MARHRPIQQLVLTMVALFAAGSALGGGIAMLVGVIEFPLEWLQGSVFRSYTIPAIVLAVIVGGSQLIAAAVMIRHEAWRLHAVVFAGVMMMGWIVGEIVIVGSEAGLMRTLQGIYFATGLVEAALAGMALTAETRAA